VLFPLDVSLHYAAFLISSLSEALFESGTGAVEASAIANTIIPNIVNPVIKIPHAIVLTPFHP